MAKYLIQRGTRDLFGWNAEMFKNKDLELFEIDMDMGRPFSEQAAEFVFPDEPESADPLAVGFRAAVADTEEGANAAAIAAAESGQHIANAAPTPATVTLLADDPPPLAPSAEPAPPAPLQPLGVPPTPVDTASEPAKVDAVEAAKARFKRKA